MDLLFLIGIRPRNAATQHCIFTILIRLFPSCNTQYTSIVSSIYARFKLGHGEGVDQWALLGWAVSEEIDLTLRVEATPILTKLLALTTFRLSRPSCQTCTLARLRVVCPLLRKMSASASSSFTVPEGFTLHKENRSAILLPASNDAFLNPVQEFNRDLSVACIRTWGDLMNEEKEKKWRQTLARRAKKAEAGAHKAKKAKSESRTYLNAASS